MSHQGGLGPSRDGSGPAIQVAGRHPCLTQVASAYPALVLVRAHCVGSGDQDRCHWAARPGGEARGGRAMATRKTAHSCQPCLRRENPAAAARGMIAQDSFQIRGVRREPVEVSPNDVPVAWLVIVIFV